MLTFPLPEYCDTHHTAIQQLHECHNELASPDSAGTLADYGAENEQLGYDYESIESTSLLDLRYNIIADSYILVSRQYDSECKIKQTKKGNQYIKTLGAKYRIDSFTVSNGEYDGVHLLSNTSALGIVYIDNGDTVYTKVFS